MFDSALFAGCRVCGWRTQCRGRRRFLTLPAPGLLGVPPVVANATGTVALLPGYIAGAWGFREHRPPGLSIRLLVVLSLIGGAAGAALLLITPDATFRRVVPWLLLAATALFAFGPQLRSMLAGGKPFTAKATVGVLAVAAYGGYFNGGLGILLLALFGLLGQTAAQRHERRRTGSRPCSRPLPWSSTPQAAWCSGPRR